MEKITVFSTPSCPWCVQLKHYLKSLKIDFKDVDVSENEKEAAKMFEKSHQLGVPQIWIGDKVVVGFDVERINHLLGGARGQ